MRALVVFVTALAVAALLIAVCKPVRTQVEAVLFRSGTEGPTPAQAAAAPTAGSAAHPSDEAKQAAPAQPVAPPQPASQEPVVPAPSEAPEVTPSSPSAPLVATAEAPAPAAPRPEPEKPVAPPAQPVVPPPEARAPAATGTQRIELPAELAAASFGMTPEQVASVFDTAWRREQANELMLVHYRDAERRQTVRFHFAGKASLYAIEARFKPAAEQTLQELYDQLRTYCAETYANVPDSSLTHWSDGQVTVSIGVVLDEVEVRFACPAAQG